jgi:hypothetical protein
MYAAWLLKVVLQTVLYKLSRGGFIWMRFLC